MKSSCTTVMNTLKEKVKLFHEKVRYSVVTKSVSGDYNNWIIPGYIMCGPFPGCDGLTYNEYTSCQNLTQILNSGIDTFICLQDEISPQDGSIGKLLKPSFYWAFPKLINYSFFLQERSNIKYIHWPIADQHALSLDTLIQNISKIIDMLNEGRRIFIHCAGGHGRTGIYSACLIALLENCDAHQALKQTQERHDSRHKWDGRQQPESIVLSPSSKLQRELVKEFCKCLNSD